MRALGHLRLRVGPDHVRTDEAGLDEDAAGATHRVQNRPSWLRTGDVRDGASQQRIHAAGLEEGFVRRGARPEIADALGCEPADRTGRDLLACGPLIAL